MHFGLRVKYLFLSDFNQKQNISTNICKNPLTINFLLIRLEVELFQTYEWADWQTGGQTHRRYTGASHSCRTNAHKNKFLERNLNTATEMFSYPCRRLFCGSNKSNEIFASRHVLPQQKQDRQCRNILTLRHVRATIVTVDKQQVLHILSVCLQTWASSVQCASAQSVASSAVCYFSTLSHKRQDFRKKKKKVIEYEV